MAAHLAGQRGAGFLELGLDQRVAGVPHQRRAAVLLDPRRQQARAFDVVDDGAARHARQHVGGEQHQLAVRVDDLAVLGDDAETVAVAVEGDADFGVGILERLDHVGQIFRFGRVWVVVGEVAVNLAIERHDFATQALEQLRCDRAGDAVAAIHDDLQRPCQLDVADDLVDVGGNDIGAALAALAAAYLASFDAPLQVLDGVER